MYEIVRLFDPFSFLALFIWSDDCFLKILFSFLWPTFPFLLPLLISFLAFLFVRQEDAEPNAVVKAIKDARDFKCPGCEHRNYRHWPPLPSTIDNAEWLVVKSQTAYLREELRCFFTKVSFTEKPLGKPSPFELVRRLPLSSSHGEMLFFLGLGSFTTHFLFCLC